MEWEKAYDNRIRIRDYVTVEDVLKRLPYDDFTFPFYVDETLHEELTLKIGKERTPHFSKPGGGGEGGKGSGVSWAHTDLCQTLAQRGKIVVRMRAKPDDKALSTVYMHFNKASCNAIVDGFKPDVLATLIDLYPYSAELLGEMLQLEANLSHAVEAFKRMMLYFGSHLTLEIDWPSEFAKRAFTKSGKNEMFTNTERLFVSFSEERRARWIVPPFPKATSVTVLDHSEIALDHKREPLLRIWAAIVGIAKHCKGATIQPTKSVQEPLKRYAEYDEFQISRRIEPAVVEILRSRQLLMRGLLPAEDPCFAQAIVDLGHICHKVSALIDEGKIKKR